MGLLLASLLHQAGPAAGPTRCSCDPRPGGWSALHEGLEVLRDGRELEFVSCSAWTPEAKSFKAMMAFEVRELHLDLFSLIT